MSKNVRLGFIGCNYRGSGMLSLLSEMEDVDIVAVCDRIESNANKAAAIVTEKGKAEPAKYLDHHELLSRDDIQGVIACTAWLDHVNLAVDCMRAGKYIGFEVGGACSVEECWRLVYAYEETGVPCMMLENCCYGRNELALLNMIKQGLFGELIHMQGAYGHDLSHSLVSRIQERHYRTFHYHHRNCENYPTHELGPICNMLNINRGNRLLTLTSTASKARGLNARAAKMFGEDSMPAQRHWNQGDVITTVIKCAHGETITINLDTTLPRPYSRELCVQGTEGIYMEDGNRIYIEGISQTPHEWDCFAPYLEKYEHPLWKWFKNTGVKGGHGGMDYLVQRAFIESIRDNRETPIDVYDTATWMSITALSEDSIALGSMPVAIPDFTNGLWIDRRPDPKCRYSLDAVHNDLF